MSWFVREFRAHLWAAILEDSKREWCEIMSVLWYPLGRAHGTLFTKHSYNPWHTWHFVVCCSKSSGHWHLVSEVVLVSFWMSVLQFCVLVTSEQDHCSLPWGSFIPTHWNSLEYIFWWDYWVGCLWKGKPESTIWMKNIEVMDLRKCFPQELNVSASLEKIVFWNTEI